MSKRNILAAFFIGAAMFAGSAAADGKTKRVYKPGPAPLNVTCPDGYTKDRSNRCVRTIRPRPTTTCPQGYTRTTTGKCVRQVTQRTCPSGYTRNAQGQCLQIQRPPVVKRPPVVTRPPVQQVSLDLGSFTGGVGAGVDGGYYGGNGFIPLSAPRSFSGVLNASASAFTFNRSVKNNGGGKGHRPKPRHPKPKPMMPKPKPGCGGCGGK